MTTEQNHRWTPDTQPAAELIDAMIRIGDAPGVIGCTNPSNAAATREQLGHPALLRDVLPADTTTAPGAARLDSPMWTQSEIEAWRDEEIGWLRKFLFDPDATTSDPRTVTRVGLALCDMRVRDVIIGDLVNAGAPARAMAGEHLWPVATGLPAAYRAPAATVLALAEMTLDRPVGQLLAWGTEATPDYRLAQLLQVAASAGIPVPALMATLGSMSESQARHGAARDPLATDAGDPLASQSAQVPVEPDADLAL